MSSNKDEVMKDNLCLELQHLDVVGGDATLILVRNSNDDSLVYKMLIDAGGEGRGSAKLITYLNSLKGDKDATLTLDCIIATHYHQDHIDGFTRFADFVSFRKVMDNGGYKLGGSTSDPVHGIGDEVRGSKIFSQYTTVIQKNLCDGKVAAREEIPFIAKDAKPEAAKPVTLKLGSVAGVPTLTCYCANGILANGVDVLASQIKSKNKGVNPNDLSLAFVLEWEGFRYFTAGDLSGDREFASYYNIEDALVDYLTDATSGPLKDRPITVLKVSHHGSERSNQLAMFEKLKPQVILVSCNTVKDVPSPVFLERLETYLKANPKTTVLFVNKLQYFNRQPEYGRLANIKGYVPDVNIEFKKDKKGSQIVTNLGVKAIHIRRYSGGAEGRRL
jgi:beta-lactamase superfamily II metal-dependent hydrolase